MKRNEDGRAPNISLIIPCYNVAPWIDRMLDSVVKQTFTNFEVIVIDDGSTDDTVYHLEKWSKCDPRIRVVHLVQNRGPYQARLVGIAYARAQWVTFADADDVLMPNHLDNLWHGVDAKTGVVVGGIRAIRPDGKQYDYGLPSGRYTSNEILEKILIGHHSNGLLSCWNKLYRLSVLERTELDRTLITNCGEDQVFNIRVFYTGVVERFSVVVRSCPTYCYISRPGSIMRSMQATHVRDFFVLWEERDRVAGLLFPPGDLRWREYERMRLVAVWDFCGNLARMGTRELRRAFKQELLKKPWRLTPDWSNPYAVARWVKWLLRMAI